MVVHLHGVGEAEADVAGIPVEEEDSGTALLPGAGLQEQPRVDADTVRAADHVRLVGDVMLGGAPVAGRVLGRPSGNAPDGGKVQHRVLFGIEQTDGADQQSTGDRPQPTYERYDHAGQERAALGPDGGVIGHGIGACLWGLCLA